MVHIGCAEIRLTECPWLNDSRWVSVAGHLRIALITEAHSEDKRDKL